VPTKGWSGADKQDGPLYDPDMNNVFLSTFRQSLDPQIRIEAVDHHINDEAFGEIAANLMDAMVRRSDN
jgi:uncharacterized protein (UPF0261 family)